MALAAGKISAQPFIKLKTYTVAEAATLDAATAGVGAIIRVSNGDAGALCLAMSDGTDWKRIVLGAAISAT